jgi:DNA-binding response OmpR family regulator
LHQIESLSFSDEKSALFRDIDDQIGQEAPVINFNPVTESDEDKKTVLIVEDHPEVRAFIQDIVSTQYLVILASNGHKALKILEKEQIDLVITDLMMPILDGFELLEEMKKRELRKIPALVLSARTSEEDKQKVLAQGVNDFLFKPFNPDELLMRIDNLLSMKEVWKTNELDQLVSSKQETLDDIEKSILKKVERLIIERVEDTNLNIGYLANEVAVSERKYYRMIKKLTGNTPLEMIKEIRLQMAHKMLTEKNIKSASEVAKLVGIANVTHFNGQFKKRFGQVPTDMLD